MKRSLLSIVIVLAMIVGSMPVYARAEETARENRTGSTSSSDEKEFGSFTSGSQVLADMIANNEARGTAHPRIIMTEDKFAKLRAHIGDGSVTALLLEELRGEADRHVSEDPVCVYDAYGDKHLVETSKTIQRRVCALALAYNIFGDDAYALRCYQEMKAACKFPDWSPKHFLDTAEMCTALALGYDWLYDWLNDDQKEMIRDSLIVMGLRPVMEDYTDTPSDRKRTYKWYQDLEGDNWQLVCTGGTNLAALAIGDEPEAKDIAAKVLTYGYKRAYTFVRNAYRVKDGTYIEGLGYWDYATYYLGMQSSALISATGTDYGLADFEGILKSAEFVRYMSSNTPKSFSFGDDRDSRDTGWPVFLWLGEHYDRPDLSAIRLGKIDEDKEFRYWDVLWIDESKQTGVKLEEPTEWGSVGACNASFRDTWEVKDGLVTALHVGENCYKYHGHYDLGTFYLESNGNRFFTDLGNEKYDLKNRQYAYRIKAEGHNTLVINPKDDIDQKEGANCLITDYRSGDEPYAITDLTEAYEPSGATSVVRGLKMIKDKKCVIIQDEISLQAKGELYWFGHTTGDIEVAADGRSAIITVNGDRMWVGILSEGGCFTAMDAVKLDTSRNVSGQTDNEGYRKLAIHLTNIKDTTISVACIPLKKGEKTPAWTPVVTPLSEWADDADIRYCNISLSDNIGLNLYARLKDSIANAAGASMVFTLDGKKVSIKVSDAEKVNIEGESLYKFTCPVPASRMTGDITAQLQVLSDGKLTEVGETYHYSVRNYADEILGHSDRYDAETLEVVKAMLNYGAYAQEYFSVNTDRPANKNIYKEAEDPVLLFDQDLSGMELGDIATKGDLVFYGASLLCNGETSLKLYFLNKSGAAVSSGRYTVKAVSLGQARECSGVADGNMYVVTLSGITAPELNQTYEFTITDSKSSSNRFGFTYSPVNYMANAQNSPDRTLVNLARAMYLYNRAALDCR